MPRNFISPVKAVESIWIEPLPSSKVLSIKKAIRVGRGVLMLGEDGKLYSTDAGRYCFSPHDAERQEPWFKALKALDQLTQEQMDAHLAAVAYNDKSRELRYAADDLYRLQRNHGIKLTKAQQQLVDQHSAQKKRDQQKAETL